MAADVVGYSRLVETDEAGTLAAIKVLRANVIDPLVAEHHGRIAKLMGDGLIVEFSSVVDAVGCAILIQKQVSTSQSDVASDRRIAYRIGINLGDVVIEDGDLLGDGVNIAARLEALAEPGSILVSNTVHDHLQGRLTCRLDDLGDRTLKNIGRPVRVYRVAWESSATGDPTSGDGGRLSKASIAVLPFTNMSSDPEQEYFADGLTEDLITDLSKVPGLFVIARHSTFSFKGRFIDVRTIAKDLCVRYVVEGSVRRTSNRVRINVQLIDAKDGSHIWADRFDRDLNDIFALQDEVVARLVKALSAALPLGHPLGGRRATSLEAYDLFVKARPLVIRSPKSNRTALSLLQKAVQLDPTFAEAFAWLAMCHHFGWMYWDQERRHPEALEAASRAVSLDPENADGHMVLGYVRAYAGALDAGLEEFETALKLNPNHSDAWAFSADLKVFDGQAIAAVDSVRRAFRLNPYPPAYYYWLLGWSLYAARRYEEAVETLRQEAAYESGAQRILAASLAQLGRIAEAKPEVEGFLAAVPQFSTQRWARTQPFRDNADRQHFIDGYLKAGLPP